MHPLFIVQTETLPALLPLSNMLAHDDFVFEGVVACGIDRLPDMSRRSTRL